MQNESEIIEKLLTPFYTLAELRLFGITPEYKEQLDK
jgi:hypothetical protein